MIPFDKEHCLILELVVAILHSFENFILRAHPTSGTQISSPLHNVRFFFSPGEKIKKKIDKVSKNIKQRRIKITENNLPISRSLKDFFFFFATSISGLLQYSSLSFFFPTRSNKLCLYKPQKEKKRPVLDTHKNRLLLVFIFVSFLFVG